MKQRQKNHGGILALKKRNSRRPIDIRKPLHVVLRSDHAKGKRALKNNRKIVEEVFQVFALRFRIRVYEKAICGNHLHCLIRAQTRREMQNFLRVLAGQIAQRILNKFPLAKFEKKAFRGGTHPKNHKTFWSLLAFSRIVSWGWDFIRVKKYVVQNTLETLGLVPYKKRKSRFPEDLLPSG